MINVAVVGYGIIGKRVADAVDAQEDMALVGVADIAATKLMSVATQRGFPIYCAAASELEQMKVADFPIEGDLSKLLDQTDVVVDATPKGCPKGNIPRYQAQNVKYVIEGGEKHDLTGASFNTFANFDQSLGLMGTRVVSCNTTALCRLLSTVDQSFGVETYYVNLTRRGADPINAGVKGPSNAVVPVLGGSHHYEDVETCMPHLDGKGYSTALATSHTLSHVHSLELSLGDAPSVEDIIMTLDDTPRISVISGEADGLTDTARIAEYYSDLRRLRGDHPEVSVWSETIHQHGGRYYLMFDVHMQSIPIPENVDAIRALMGFDDKWDCIKMTDQALDSYLPGFAKNPEFYSAKGV